jgi:hypothetical protein
LATRAHPELLQQVAERDDVQDVRLRLNYRSGSRIVAASEYALGEKRGYEAPEDAAEGTIYFHPRDENYDGQAQHLFDTILSAVRERNPEVTLGRIAILYPAAWIGDSVANAAQEHSFGVIRSDTNALYPRSNRLMRWLELCAMWCCDGWRTGTPRFLRLVGEGHRLFAETLISEKAKYDFQRRLLETLWSRRDSAMTVHEWLAGVRDELVGDLVGETRTADEDLEVLDGFIDLSGPTGDIPDMTLGVFSGFGEGSDRLNLSTFTARRVASSRWLSCLVWMRVAFPATTQAPLSFVKLGDYST